MTTIAYRDGIMVADGRRQNGNEVKVGECEKITFLDDCIIGASGEVVTLEKFLEWMKDGADKRCKPDIEKPFTAIVVYADEVVEIWTQGLMPMMQEAPFYACGSGYELAMGAMAHGATAEEAVVIACEYDAHSDGPLQIVKVGG